MTEQFKRPDGRFYNEGRPAQVVRHFTKHAPGSVLMAVGDTKVLCTAMCEETVPGFMRGEGRGWVTAEYSMLPSATETRKRRDRNGKTDGRSVEIQRLIGRSLRSVVAMDALGERTIRIDCDVIQADGGTRTTAITGAFIALWDCAASLLDNGMIEENPIRGFVASTSVGVWQGRPILDLCYLEDAHAEVDMNLVMTDDGRIIEIQGTGEARPFTRDEFDQLMALGQNGIAHLIAVQKDALGIRE
jgi:ribonuclease PH